MVNLRSEILVGGDSWVGVGVIGICGTRVVD